PPLRKRQSDIILLAQRFCRELGGDKRLLPSHLLVRWQDYTWPGNVRELRNAVARVLALGEFDAPSAHTHMHMHTWSSESTDLVERILSMGMPLSEAKHHLLEEFEQRYIEHMLDEHQGNVTRAAAASRVGRRYFQRLRARKT